MMVRFSDIVKNGAKATEQDASQPVVDTNNKLWLSDSQILKKRPKKNNDSISIPKIDLNPENYFDNLLEIALEFRDSTIKNRIGPIEKVLSLYSIGPSSLVV